MSAATDRQAFGFSELGDDGTRLGRAGARAREDELRGIVLADRRHHGTPDLHEDLLL